MDDLELHNDLMKQLEIIRKKRNFQEKPWIEKKLDMLNKYMKDHKLQACVISVSGGIDSGVTIALAKAASKKEGSPIKKIIGVAQPIHSTEDVWTRALELKDCLDVEIVTVDQTPIFDQLKQLVDKQVGIKGDKFASGQLKSYMRTPVGYYVSQLLNQEGYPSIVLGTGNQDEDGYLYYFCKAGDGISDVQLIADLHKSEVYRVGAEMNLPKIMLESGSTADLWEGQSDENELGFNYDLVELWTTYVKFSDEEKNKMKEECSEEAWKQFQEMGAKAKKVYERNKHKDEYPLNLNTL